MKNTRSERKRIIIIGGGFGGLYAAKNLADKDVEVTLIDRRNHHTFQPLLHQVAAAVLSPGKIAMSLCRIFSAYKNIEVILGEVIGIDKTARTVKFKDNSTLEYDYLIVAAGARHFYFGNDDWESFAPGLKTVDDAIEIRRRILLAFELAETNARLTQKSETLTFSVIGGGPTGVELAGVIAGIAKRSLVKDSREIKTNETRIIIFDGGERILSGYAKDLSEKAARQLNELGVEVFSNSKVIAVEQNRLNRRLKIFRFFRLFFMGHCSGFFASGNT